MTEVVYDVPANETEHIEEWSGFNSRMPDPDWLSQEILQCGQDMDDVTNMLQECNDEMVQYGKIYAKELGEAMRRLLRNGISSQSVRSIAEGECHEAKADFEAKKRTQEVLLHRLQNLRAKMTGYQSIMRIAADRESTERGMRG